MGAAVDSLYGIPVYTNPNLVRYHTVQRTWRERWFTRPWRPRQRTKVVTMPADEAYLVNPGQLRWGMRGPCIVVHPAYLEQWQALGKAQQAAVNAGAP